MEGYYWRFADPGAGRALIVLCGVCRAPDGVWALIALAATPDRPAGSTGSTDPTHFTGPTGSTGMEGVGGPSPGLLRWIVAENAWADPEGFGVEAPPFLRATADHLVVDLGADARVSAAFADRVGWPWRSFGALGIAQVAPGLPQYWQPVMLGARVRGSARLGDLDADLGGASVYAEKNWGGAFPAEWWWGQAGFGGGAMAAFAGGRLRGPLAAGAIVVSTGASVVRFSPPGAAVVAEAGGGEWRLRGRSARYAVLVEGEGGVPHVLPVPVVAERRAVLRSEHHLAGRLRVRLRRGSRVVLDESSSLAALEHGTPQA